MVVGGWAGNGNPGEAVWWCIHPAVCGTRAGGDLSLHGWHGALHTETGRRCESLICLCHACVVPFMQNWSLTWVMHCLCHACMVPFIQNWSLTWVTHCLCQACMVPVIQNWSLTCVSHCLCHACMVPFIQKLVNDLSHSSFFVMSAYRNWSLTWITHLPFSHLRLWGCGIHPLTSPIHPSVSLSVSYFSECTSVCSDVVFSPVGMDSLAKTGVTDFLCFCIGSLDMG